MFNFESSFSVFYTFHICRTAAIEHRIPYSCQNCSLSKHARPFQIAFAAEQTPICLPNLAASPLHIDSSPPRQRCPHEKAINAHTRKLSEFDLTRVHIICVAAPEIFACAADECVGYSFAVDWWSLGVVAFELVCGSRPFDIHSSTPLSDVQTILATPPSQPVDVSGRMWDLLARLLSARPGERPCSLEELPLAALLPGSGKETILSKSITPQFTPPKGHLNCDPTFELEEMIIEARPLHKKKKRLAKQRSIRENQLSLDLDPELADPDSPTMIAEFRIFNREREMERKEREEREAAWEQELIQAMNASEMSSIPIKKTTAMSLDEELLEELDEEEEEENDETEADKQLSQQDNQGQQSELSRSLSTSSGETAKK
ncbi:Hypothetical predicted protein [Cloeon dipterum]|uniref:Protein kinase domain-containing protein n=1 Tax=Cloeon dipterum TaxID=197152 RepID=A0A8S1CHA2_9INSE|nr:Hypothetical predicted protein [Cloeon dipterum]